MEIRLEYLVQMTTPLHVGTGVGFARVVDATVVRANVRDAADVKVPCIPGSSIKGKLRYHTQRLSRLLGQGVCSSAPGDQLCKKNYCVQCRLYGSPFLPGTLHFSDALPTRAWQDLAIPVQSSMHDQPAQEQSALGLIRRSNKLERGTRTVEQDFLFSLEHTAESLVFAGCISGSIPQSEGVLPEEGWFLLASLQMLDKLGGVKSRGLGRCRTQVTQLTLDGAEFAEEELPLLLQDLHWLKEA